MRYGDAHYPVFLDLANRKAVVVGGGSVAERKVATLLAYGAEVTVIAPEVTEELAAVAAAGPAAGSPYGSTGDDGDEADGRPEGDGAGRLTLVPRGYVRGDLEGAFVVVSATDSEETNRAVHAEAASRGQLVNVVDVPELCNFIVPSIVRRGPLQIAVSTGGAAPAVARRLRQRFEDEFGDEWGRYLELLGELRRLGLERLPQEGDRRRLFEAAAARPELLALVREGRAPSAEELFEELSRPSG